MKSFGGSVHVGRASASLAPVSISSATTGGTITGLSGLGNGTANFQDFYLVSSGSNGSAFDVLYTLTTANATSSTIAKFSLVSGNWTTSGTSNTTFGGFGLAAAWNGSGANLYATTGTGATAANSLVSLTDTAGWNSAINISGSPITLYTAAAGTTMKGVDFVPVPEPSTYALIGGVGTVGLIIYRRRRKGSSGGDPMS